jgi:hypothetical protein
LQLQDSCHEARTEINELKQENSRIRMEFRERDKYWKALWNSRKSEHVPEPDSLPPTPPAYSPSHTQPASMAPPIGPARVNQYGAEHMGYRTSPDLSNGPYQIPPGHGYPHQSSPLPLPPGPDPESVSGAGPSHHPLHPHQRMPKYGQYSYPMQSPSRSPNSSWTEGVPPSVAETATSPNAPPHPPAYGGSPTLTPSDMSFVNRYPVEDQKLNLETTAYVFTEDRSLSPTGSSSSSSITSPFQFAFPEGSISPDRPEYDYHRQNRVPGEVTLHGGTADISVASPGTEGVRYRLPRRANSGPERPLIPVLPPPSKTDNDSPRERDSSEPESANQSHHQRPRLHRSATTLTQLSRSPSPGGSPPISGTLAVIKAQAFGALRRTRTRTRKSSERDVTKVAMDVLELRGMGVPISGSKRPCVRNDDLDA